MLIGATDYRLAAEEHLRAAGRCHFNGDYLTCHYLCGLAVECILRAYRWNIDPSWDGRHVLPDLYRSSGFDVVVPSSEAGNAAYSFSVISSRWENYHRFTSPDKLKKHLNRIGVTRNVKGDKLERNSSQMYDAAKYMVELGLSKWRR